MSSQSPQPETWGSPKAFWSSSQCPTKSFFGPQRIVINTTLCGDWAGSAYSSDPTCPGTCAERVADPKNFDSKFCSDFIFLCLRGSIPDYTRLIGRFVDLPVISCAVEDPLCYRLPVNEPLFRSRLPSLGCRSSLQVSLSPLVSIDQSRHFNNFQTLPQDHVTSHMMWLSSRRKTDVALVAPFESFST